MCPEAFCGQVVRDRSNNREKFFINRDLFYDRTCQYVFLRVSVAATRVRFRFIHRRGIVTAK